MELSPLFWEKSKKLLLMLDKYDCDALVLHAYAFIKRNL